MRTWQESANSRPPPKAKPLIAAITGFCVLAIKSNTFSCPWRERASPSAASNSANSEISAPATKAFSPLPVRTITRTFSSSFNARNKLFSSAKTAWFKALSFLGRLMLTQAILSCFSSNKWSSVMRSYFVELNIKKGSLVWCRTKVDGPVEGVDDVFNDG